ncbi:plasmid partitioning protein ParB [Mesorhizobium sp. LSJC255A00]|uniref:plasmid partitioning protein ParB n=1 Tax=Mesorhizobium sp. LSJC255A00 TaxID=1287313 RepID=UPI0003CE5104|nr:plasmid partitioning protein ParB [Mesorhizobium sp. LSJC255A00]ESX22141.1 plasmid partitioning protein ParB [Mesorhizobium sp. LSJC255A00]
MPETFREAVAWLRAEAGQDARTAKPRRLPLGHILVAPAVFQVRTGAAAGGVTEPLHVQALQRALEAKHEDVRVLDPVTVYAVGKGAYCIDGHHRLAAYRAAKVKGSVPVEWFEGSLAEAIAEAAKRNQKVKLPMTQTERLEAAWRLVILGAHSKRKTAEASGVSERTVANMRALYRQAVEQELKVGSYVETLRATQWDDDFEYTDAMREARVNRYVQGLVKQFGPRTPTHVEEFAEAVAKWGGSQFAGAMASWLAPAGYEEFEDTDF